MHSDITGLIILVFCVVFFITKWLPASVTGVLGCFLMVLLKVAPFQTVFSGFSSEIVLLMASAMIVGIAMFKTGAAPIIGRFVIRFAHGREKVFLFVSCLVAGVLAMFLANTAVLAAFIPIIDSVCRTSSSIKRKNILLPLACAIMFGGACTLIGCTPQLTANGIMASLVGVEMGMWTLTGPGLCLFAIFFIYMMTIGYKIGDKVWGDRPEVDLGVDEEKIESVVNAEYDKKKLGCMFTIVILMIISYATGILTPAMTAMAAALLCIILDCCSVKDILKELSWESIVFLASCLGLANALTVCGSGQLIGSVVSGLIGGTASPFLIYAVLVLLALVISQFVTNSTAIIIVLPIAISLCQQYGFSPMTFCVGITMAASMACCTPLAAAQITMTQVAGYEFGDYLKYGWLLSLVEYIGTLIFVPLFFPLV